VPHDCGTGLRAEIFFLREDAMHSFWRKSNLLWAVLMGFCLVAALPTPSTARPRPGKPAKGFRLFAKATGALTINRIYCGLSATGEICVDSLNSSTVGGGFWPKGTADQYVFNSGLQLAGIIGPDANPEWQGDTTQAQLFSPSRSVGFVAPSQRVTIRYPAYPYQKFGQQPARVVQVSRTPLAPSELAALALPALGNGSEPMFRITVALEGAPVAGPLAAGMRLQADVLLERRRLIEWLFEPLLGLRSRL